MDRPMNEAEATLAKYAIDHGGWRVGTTVTLRGPPINESDLSETLKLAQRRHPMLRTRINISKPKGEIMWTEDSELRIPVKAYSSGDKESAYLDATQESLQDGDGVFRVCIVSENESNGGDTEMVITSLIFLCEHFACDGMSFLTVIHEILLGFADSNSVKHLPLLPVPEGVHFHGKNLRGSKAMDYLKVMRIVLGAVANSFKGKNVNIASFGDNEIERRDLTTRCTQVYLTETISKTQTKGLLSRCREHETTITGVISSVIADSVSEFIQTQNGETKSQTVSTSLAVDARRYYSPPLENHHLSFQVTGVVPTPLKATGSGDLDEMWTNAKIYKNGLTSAIIRGDQKTILPRIGTAITGLYNMESVEARGQPHVFFTNWGKMPFDKIYGSEWEVIEVSPGINTLALPFPTLIASSFNGELQLTLLGPHPVLRKEHLNEILDGAVARLTLLSS
mmetsp:Transcript_830/g.1132  ORF Transcript_830/g.1132 Transcript_830/m.1132 type:complete len:452 (+) Transcript_830:309-1664(+)|eukprot:CAMPEP_0204835994 /NCGR_PEP_ID=MMETSP1346-20131115/24192_1 /ASSEMBLY_ACC=CAM_ASM_000771 /TAXON_ID=215587 /ORGANISM="Aplanochytrium stocchinoi, Strain GSBS06" /LENGTH=451 /DNA_ID=CAMNT_0051970449 /DNA_START=196 /DNA_END=1551 /DNA_ORIENTATION=+